MSNIIGLAAITIQDLESSYSVHSYIDRFNVCWVYYVNTTRIPYSSGDSMSIPMKFFFAAYGEICLVAQVAIMGYPWNFCACVIKFFALQIETLL